MPNSWSAASTRSPRGDYRVKVSAHALSRNGILAGSDRERAGEVAAFFADPQVKAIFAARGGYGSGRLLPILDFAAIARTPKIFVGFSDLSFLFNPIVESRRHGLLSRPDGGPGVRALTPLISTIWLHCSAASWKASRSMRARWCGPGWARARSSADACR